MKAMAKAMGESIFILAKLGNVCYCLKIAAKKQG